MVESDAWYVLTIACERPYAGQVGRILLRVVCSREDGLPGPGVESSFGSSKVTKKISQGLASAEGK